MGADGDQKGARLPRSSETSEVWGHEYTDVKAKDAAARQVFETLSGILYRVKPDDQVRRGEIHDLFAGV